MSWDARVTSVEWYEVSDALPVAGDRLCASLVQFIQRVFPDRLRTLALPAEVDTCQQQTHQEEHDDGTDEGKHDDDCLLVHCQGPRGRHYSGGLGSWRRYKLVNFHLRRCPSSNVNCFLPKKEFHSTFVKLWLMRTIIFAKKHIIVWLILGVRPAKETSLQSNAVSHWLGANLESTLLL